MAQQNSTIFMTLVWHQCPSLKVMSLRAKRQVSCLTSAEKVPVFNSGILLLIRVTQIISLGCISQRMKRGRSRELRVGPWYLFIQADGSTQTFGSVDETLRAVCETHERKSHSLVAGWTISHTQKASMQWAMPVKRGLWSSLARWAQDAIAWRGVHTAPWRILQSRYKDMVLEQSREDGSIVAYRQDLHSSFPSVSEIESRNSCIFQNRDLFQPQNWRTAPGRLSATAYSIYSQLSSVLEAVLPSATGGRAMLITGNNNNNNKNNNYRAFSDLVPEYIKF